MEEMPEGPEADAVRARFRKRMAEHRRELLDRGHILGLQQPTFAEGFVAASNNHSVTLMYGDVLALEGPLLTIRTARVRLLGLEDSVEAYLDDEHRRLSEHAAIEVPDPGPLQMAHGELTVRGQPIEVDVLRDRFLWATQVDGPDPERPERFLVLTVVSRGVPASEVRLDNVSDLQPFFDRREQVLRMLAERMPRVRSEDLDLPPSQGLSAHRALIEYMLEETAELEATVRAGRRLSARTSQDRQRLWESAVRAQMHLADQGRPAARAAVASMVNQLTTLNSTAAWFAEPGPRSAAIEEIIGYSVFGGGVRSLPAQQAWDLLWSSRRGFGLSRLTEKDRSPGPLSADKAADLRRRFESDRDRRRAWSDAWDQWHRDVNQ